MDEFLDGTLSVANAVAGYGSATQEMTSTASNAPLSTATLAPPSTSSSVLPSIALKAPSATTPSSIPPSTAMKTTVSHTDNATLPPLLIIHGDADVNVPVENGVELHACAAEPKRLVVIRKANHLLTGSAYLKKALKEISALVTTGQFLT